LKRYSDTRYTELFSHPIFVQRLLENFVEEDFVSQLESYIPRLRYYVIEERMFPAGALLEMRNLVALLFYAETVSPSELALSIDRLFDILKAEDAGAVQLFSRWLNDYFRQVARLTLGTADVPDLPDFDPEETQPMLAENLTNWFKKAYEDGKLEGIEKGIEKERRESARKFLTQMLKRGLPIEEVAAIAEMNTDDVRTLIT